MFEKLAGLATTALGAGATGGASFGVQVLVWVIRHLPEIILCIVIVVVLSMYGCQKSRAESLAEDKAKLEETVKQRDAEIVSLQEEVAVQKDLVARRTAELGITKAALDKQGAVEAETEEKRKEKDALLDAWAAEQDPEEKKKLEAAYWNTILGVKAVVDNRTKAIRLLGPVKPVRTGGVR